MCLHSLQGCLPKVSYESNAQCIRTGLETTTEGAVPSRVGLDNGDVVIFKHEVTLTQHAH